MSVSVCLHFWFGFWLGVKPGKIRKEVFGTLLLVGEKGVCIDFLICMQESHMSFLPCELCFCEPAVRCQDGQLFLIPV